VTYLDEPTFQNWDNPEDWDNPEGWDDPNWGDNDSESRSTLSDMVHIREAQDY